MDAPKPSMVWYVVPGSITIVGSELVPVPNVTGARSCSCSARSGVVTQIRAWTGAAAGAAPTAEAGRPAASRMPALTAAGIVRRLIVVTPHVGAGNAQRRQTTIAGGGCQI